MDGEGATNNSKRVRPEEEEGEGNEVTDESTTHRSKVAKTEEEEGITKEGGGGVNEVGNGEDAEAKESGTGVEGDDEAREDEEQTGEGIDVTKKDDDVTKKDGNVTKEMEKSKEEKEQSDARETVEGEDSPAQPRAATTGNTANDEETILEEKGEVSAMYVGRVIGKGGEMIRDLQARSGCRIDVDQNVPEGAPRLVTYRGTRRTIDFAKRLIDMLCSQNGKEADLPLGEATRKHLVVPSNVIGKIIGRGGEMIRELQSKSQAKIQVDHTGAGGVDPSQRQVTITGTEISVLKAEEMINFLTSNPTMDAMQALAMLIDEKTKHGGRWGSGPPYASMPNGGQNMQPTNPNANANYYQQHSPYPNYNQPNYQQQPYSSQGYQSSNAPYHQQYQQYNSQYNQNQLSPSATETEIFPCPKMYMGRVIGQKGATVNDLQKRSGCDIQINQDVPPGHDCQISLRGPRQAIETAKAMLKEVIELGPNHPYAGGRGSMYADQLHYGAQSGYSSMPHSNYPHAQRTNTHAGYGQNPQQYYQQQPQTAVTSQQQPYPSQTTQQQPYPNQHYQAPNYPQQQNTTQYQPYQPGQQQYTAPTSQLSYTQQPQQSYQPAPPQPTPTQISAWKSATAADGQTYYYNEKTGETQWEKPPGF